MTRKKFIKKLMAEGFSRNEANKIAIKSRESGLPYQKYYKCECQWLKLSVAMKKAGNSLKKVSKSINKLANETMMSFQEAMYAIVQSNEI